MNKGEPEQFDPGTDCGDGNQSSVQAWRDPHIKAIRADMDQVRKNVAELRANMAGSADPQQATVAARQMALRKQLATGK